MKCILNSKIKKLKSEQETIIELYPIEEAPQLKEAA